MLHPRMILSRIFEQGEWFAPFRKLHIKFFQYPGALNGARKFGAKVVPAEEIPIMRRVAISMIRLELEVSFHYANLNLPLLLLNASDSREANFRVKS